MFSLPTDVQILKLYVAVYEILNFEGVGIPPEQEAQDFLTHYGTLARFTLAAALGIIHRFHTQHAVLPGTPPKPQPPQQP